MAHAAAGSTSADTGKNVESRGTQRYGKGPEKNVASRAERSTDSSARNHRPSRASTDELLLLRGRLVGPAGPGGRRRLLDRLGQLPARQTAGANAQRHRLLMEANRGPARLQAHVALSQKLQSHRCRDPRDLPELAGAGRRRRETQHARVLGGEPVVEGIAGTDLGARVGADHLDAQIRPAGIETRGVAQPFSRDDLSPVREDSELGRARRGPRSDPLMRQPRGESLCSYGLTSRGQVAQGELHRALAEDGGSQLGADRQIEQQCSDAEASGSPVGTVGASTHDAEVRGVRELDGVGALVASVLGQVDHGSQLAARGHLRELRVGDRQSRDIFRNVGLHRPEDDVRRESLDPFSIHPRPGP